MFKDNKALMVQDVESSCVTLSTMRSRYKSDEVLYYFKEVEIFGPVHFISPRTWTIALYVFLFLGFVRESRGRPGDSAGGGWRQARACSTGCEYERAEPVTCPQPKLLQRASAGTGVLSDTG